MNTKRILIAVLSLGNIMCANAQQSTGYFFKEFTLGKVLLKNKQFAKGKFNYDCTNKEMHFLNGATDMVIENLEDIDTIIVDTHRFIPFEKHFMEVMHGQNSTLFIDWKIKPKDIGKKGAMGTTTHGSVQAIDVNTRFQRVNGEQNLDLSVYKMVRENVYYIQVKGKLESFRNAKMLIGLFPKDKQQAVKEFMNIEKIGVYNPKDILKVLDRFSINIDSK